MSRASYLSPPDFHRLEWACRPIFEAFGTPPYLVGSALTRPDFRDIDLRLILADDVVERMFGMDGAWGTEEHPTPSGLRLLLDIALSDLIAKTAGLPWPIDFQIQSMTEANVPEHGARNPMGLRHKIREYQPEPVAPPEVHEFDFELTEPDTNKGFVSCRCGWAQEIPDIPITETDAEVKFNAHLPASAADPEVPGA